MTDSSTGGSRFDPRFNPVFQPGYDPSLDARMPVVPDHPPDFLDSPAVAPASTGEPELPFATADAVDELPIVRRVDPYLIGLWALSVAFVGLGLITVRIIADTINRLNTTGGGVSFDYNLVLVYTIAAPLLVFLGLATATGTLFLLAARRRPR